MVDVAEFRDFRLVEKHQSWTTGGPVVSRLPDPEIETLEGRASATMGEPATLALFGFATGTWMAATVFGGFISPTIEVGLAPVLIVFAGIGQFIGGLYAFRRVNALSGSAFCSFGSYNTVVGFMLLLGAAGMVPRTPDFYNLLGFLNISFGFIALAFMVASVRTNLVLTTVLFFLMCGYTLIGISVLGVPPTGPVRSGVSVAGGITLFVSAFFAYYLGMAMVVNATWNRTVLPIFGHA